MVKEKRILSYTVGYLLLGLIICFVGISNVFALSKNDVETATSATFYDISGTNSFNEISTVNNYISAYDFNVFSTNGTLTTVAGSYGGILGFKLNNALVKNNIYSLTVYLRCGSDNIYCSKSSLYPNRIAVGEYTYSAVYNFMSNQYAVEASYTNFPGSTYPFYYNSSAVQKTSAISFIFTAPASSSYVALSFTSSQTNSYSKDFLGYTIENLGSADNLSEDQVDTIINNQTTEINNNLNDMQNTLSSDIKNTEDNINSNIDDMEQSIVDSNKETQEVIKDQFNSCRDSYNLAYVSSIAPYNYSATLNDGVITMNGTSSSAGNLLINLNNANELTLNANTTYTFSIIVEGIITGSGYKTIYFKGNNVGSLESNRTIIFKYAPTENTVAANIAFDLSPNLTFSNTKIKVMLNEGSSHKNYEPYGEEICTNKLDEQNDKLEGIQGALTDSSAPNTSGLENSAGWLPAGPLDSILNLPLTMLNSLTNSLEKTCTPLNLTLPYVNKNIQIPCLSAIFAKITGVNGLWKWVGTIASVLILYNYLLNLYAWVDRVLTLRAEFDEAMGADLANWGRL